MDTRPDADVNRRLGNMETDNADKLAPGKSRKLVRRKARDHKTEARSADGRRLSSHTPIKRSRAKQTLTLEERLMKTAADYRARAAGMQASDKQAKLLEKARQFEAQVGQIT